MGRTVSLSELKGLVGVETEPTGWLVIDQDRINAFADATLDHQFIHVDPEAAAATPLGGTIAHGFLTLSLLPYFAAQRAIALEGAVMTINYGLNKVRFLNPVKSGSAVRARFRICDVREKGGGRILVTTEVTVEAQGEDKPAMIAESLSLIMTGGGQ